MPQRGNRLIEAVEELIRISREAGLPAEILPLKAGGEANWPKMARVIELVEEARKKGLKITADMYTYPAGATGLDASMPPWVLDGGYDALYPRLTNPETRKKIAAAIRTPSDEWENLFLAAGSPDRVLLVEFKSDALKPLTGKTLAEAAKLRGEDPVDTIMNLVLEDRSRVGTVYFMMSEDNLRRQIQLPWDVVRIRRRVDGARAAVHEVVGASARLRQLRAVLGKYVREDKALTLADAVHRLSGLPATNLELRDRGFLRPACSPTWSSSIRGRSPTRRRSRSRTSTPWAFATCSSTAPPCCATANTPMPGLAAHSTGREGQPLRVFPGRALRRSRP
jgi:N-acyl-D-amino-acid deacylase